MINPKVLCRKHLLGEHGELHKHRHMFEKQYSITGRIRPTIQIEPESMKKRHDELAQEILDRGYKHNSPYTQPSLLYLPSCEKNAIVDPFKSISDLKLRCKDCKERIKKNNEGIHLTNLRE